MGGLKTFYYPKLIYKFIVTIRVNVYPYKRVKIIYISSNKISKILIHIFSKENKKMTKMQQ